MNRTMLGRSAGTLMALLIAATALAADKDTTLLFKKLGTHETGLFDEGGAEIVAHDPLRQRLYIVSANAASINVLSIRNPRNPIQIATIDLSDLGGGTTSVAVQGDLLAIAVRGFEVTDPGTVVFYNSNLQRIKALTVRSLPDMLAFSPDGRWLLVANEGEPSADYTLDPEGAISVIDLSPGAASLTQAGVRHADFLAYNGAILDPSIRIFGPKNAWVLPPPAPEGEGEAEGETPEPEPVLTRVGDASVAEDLEPEYIAISEDSSTAYVTCQENNAMAVVDIASATVTQLIGLGFKNHWLEGNGFDASDEDGKIDIRPRPTWGMYLPDAIATFSVEGMPFLILANEGDARDYDGFAEEARVADLVLDETIFPDAAELQLPENLGRLKTSLAGGDTDGDGDTDILFSFGGRSFSIRMPDGSLVYDSGDDLEELMESRVPKNFNASDDDNSFDGRSDDKGPEPEGVVVAKIDGKYLAFVALERISGIAIYDVSNPFAPVRIGLLLNRDFKKDPETRLKAAGDLSPEGLIVIAAENSPTRNPLLVVANEVSGTTTLYEIQTAKKVKSQKVKSGGKSKK